MKRSSVTRSVVVLATLAVAALVAFAVERVLRVPNEVASEPSTATAAVLPIAATRTMREPDARTAIAAKGDAPEPLSLRGRVVGPDGKPEPGATVWITHVGAAPDAVDAYTIAGGDGEFALAPTQRELVLHAAGVEHGESSRAFELDATNGVVRVEDLVLPRGGVIRGRVLGLGDAPVVGIGVQAWASRGPVWTTSLAGHALEVGFRSTTTDDEGRFTFVGLRDVAHAVQFPYLNPPDRFDLSAAASVLPDGDELVLREIVEGVLRGRVVDAETRAPITRFEIDGEPRVAEDGRFEVAYSKAKHGAHVEARGYQADWCPPPSGDEVVEVALHRLANLGVLRVRASSETGEPLAAVRVRPFPDWPRAWGDWGEPESHLGQTIVRGLRAGTYHAWIDAPGRASVRRDVRVEADTETSEEVVLERSARVRIRVRDDLGLVARGIALEVDSARRRERDFAWVPADRRFHAGEMRSDSAKPETIPEADGVFEGLPAGKYVLTVHLADRDATFDFEVDAENERSFDFTTRVAR